MNDSILKIIFKCKPNWLTSSFRKNLYRILNIRYNNFKTIRKTLCKNKVKAILYINAN